MKHFKKLILRVLIASLIFSGCSNLEDSSEKSVQKYGSLVVNLKQSEDSRLMPVSEISSAVVTVSGNDMLPVEQNVLVSDGKGYFAIEQIPVGKNRIISVQALNNGVKIDGIVISALKDIVAGENVIETINAQTSVRAKVYKALFDSGVNISTLSSEQEALIDSAIPSIETWFIDSSKIASDYISGTLQDSSIYVLSPATLNINVKGSKDCTVQVTDPVSNVSSKIASDNGHNTLILTFLNKAFALLINAANHFVKPFFGLILSMLVVVDTVFLPVLRSFFPTVFFSFLGAGTGSSSKM